MTMDPHSNPEIKVATERLVALSIGLIILGILAILLPGIAVALFPAILGWVVLGGGILQVMQSSQSRAVRGRWLNLGGGALYIAAGLHLLINPVKSVAAFSFALGLLFIAEGSLTIFMAFGRRVGGAMSWFVAINGIITLVLGILTINRWPVAAMALIGLYLGLSLLLSGASLLSAALAVRKAMG